jgi:hypothetical protein
MVACRGIVLLQRHPSHDWYRRSFQRILIDIHAILLLIVLLVTFAFLHLFNI